MDFKRYSFSPASKDSNESKAKEPENPSSPARREFIRRTAMAVAGAAVIGLKYGPSDFFNNSGAESIKPGEYGDFDHRCYAEYYTKALVGHKLGGLYTSYTGINGVVDEETAFINFANQLDTMWSAKKRISTDNVVVSGVADALTKEYRENKVEHITLDDYIKRIERIIGDIKENEKFWQQIGEIKKLNPRELALVRDISSSIDGKDLVAYMMTELMPTQDGLLNKEVTDFLVRNAGREYIESIPALNDAKTSFGPYQFTEYAVYHVKETRGASTTNLALPPGQRIPGSVGKLRGDDHHKAAYLFAVDNIANLVNMASRIGKLDVLENIWRNKHLEIVQIIATAHHGPYAVIDGIPLGKDKRKAGMAEMWLANNAREDFIVSTYGNYRTYAQKTQANFNALHSKKRVEPKLDTFLLKGTPQSHAAEIALAKKYDLDNMSTDEIVKGMENKGYLVQIPRNGRGFFVDEMGRDGSRVYPGNRDTLYTARPWVKTFIENEAALFEGKFPGTRFKITALTRSGEYQNWLQTINGNASPTSTHRTGSVLDIGKYLTPNDIPLLERKAMSREQMDYMRQRLILLEKEGVILATEEMGRKTRQVTFHIFVTPEYAKRYS